MIFKHCVHPFSNTLVNLHEYDWSVGDFQIGSMIYPIQTFFALKSNFYSMHLYFSFFALTQGVFADFLAFSNYWGKNCSEAAERILKSPKYFCLTLFENNSKCRIWIFVLLKLIDLVRLFNLWLFFKKSSKCLIWILAFCLVTLFDL